jgi:hypothetical protein
VTTQLHQLEVADVFRSGEAAYLASYGHGTSREQRWALRDLSQCRSAALGGHATICDRCGHREIAYNSCRNRHCPKCQGAARARWLAAHTADLLDVEYFHVVFTLPAQLGPLALHNQRLLYGILFRSVSETLLTIARDPKHLGAHIGFLAVLHTWGQNLHHHPHIHCVVAGGGISLDGKRWIACRPGFFLPVRVLSRLFRARFLALLGKAHRDGQLLLVGSQSHFSEPTAWRRWLRQLRRIEWVVYAKPPFGGPQQVLKYLARYTHRVAISNRRLLSFDGGSVTFRVKRYADHNRPATVTLPAVEFIRRFLLHILPKGFMRIRHYGFLANRLRRSTLPRCRALLGQECQDNGPHAVSTAAPARLETESTDVCPACHTGHMVIIETLAPHPRPHHVSPIPLFDTS